MTTSTTLLYLPTDQIHSRWSITVHVEKAGLCTVLWCRPVVIGLTLKWQLFTSQECSSGNCLHSSPLSASPEAALLLMKPLQTTDSDGAFNILSDIIRQTLKRSCPESSSSLQFNSHIQGHIYINIEDANESLRQDHCR